MICKFCGNVIEDSSDFCFICGQKVVAETPAYAAEVYSQKPEGAPAEVAPEQPVYAAPAEPVYAAPVVPAEEPAKKGKKKAKKEKKAKKAEKSALSKGAKFFTGLFAALFLIISGLMVISDKILFAVICAAVAAIVALIDYKKYKKAIAAGYEDKALDLINTAMTGLCVGMAVLVLALIKAYIF